MGDKRKDNGNEMLFAYHEEKARGGQMMTRNEARALKAEDDRWCNSPSKFKEKTMASVSTIEAERVSLASRIAELQERVDELEDEVRLCEKENQKLKDKLEAAKKVIADYESPTKISKKK